jgi:predicted metal-binding protein
MIFEDSLLKQAGIYQYGLIETKQIVFSDEVRSLCEVNVCGKYGATWACPPAVGEVGECKEKCLGYDSALVFSAKYDLEDSFDYEGMEFGHSEFKKVCDKVFGLAKEKLSDFLLLSNEGCMRCSKCTYPHVPCRFPERLSPSVEGFGIRVDMLAKSANINYINGENTVTYFGLLLFRKTVDFLNCVVNATFI